MEMSDCIWQHQKDARPETFRATLVKKMKIERNIKIQKHKNRKIKHKNINILTYKKKIYKIIIKIKRIRYRFKSAFLLLIFGQNNKTR